MIFGLFKDYSDTDIIDAVQFLDEIDSTMHKYVSDSEMSGMLADTSIANEYTIKNLRMVGIYYYGLSRMFKGKPNQLNDFLLDVFKYKYKEYGTSIAKQAYVGFSNNVDFKNKYFLEGYKEAKNFKGDTLKLVDKHFKNFK
tara:strand:- start:103 stop:525 length:423 start_codon:yes stop_codon:yes gene_type:complete